MSTFDTQDDVLIHQGLDEGQQVSTIAHQPQVKCALFLDVVARQRSLVMPPLACEAEARLPEKKSSWTRIFAVTSILLVSSQSRAGALSAEVLTGIFVPF